MCPRFLPSLHVALLWVEAEVFGKREREIEKTQREKTRHSSYLFKAAVRVSLQIAMLLSVLLLFSSPQIHVGLSTYCLLSLRCSCCVPSLCLWRKVFGLSGRPAAIRS